jgi:hypothetical protein
MDDAAAGARDWADVIEEAISGVDDVVLVGHSLAGLAVPIVAGHAPLRRIVFLCANVPVPGISYSDYLVEHPDAVIIPPLTFDELGRLTVPWEAARELFYGDCDEALAREAYEHLVPSAALIANSETCPLEAWPDVAPSYIPVYGGSDHRAELVAAGERRATRCSGD